MDLEAYRSEVLVWVQRGNAVLGHHGGSTVLGWAPGIDGPRTLSEIVHPADLATVEHAMAGTEPGATRPLGTAVRVRRHDDTWNEMAVSIIGPTPDSELTGWVLRLTSPAGDIAEAATPPPGVDRFDSLAEVVTAGILTADERGAVTYANPAARELLWRTADGLVGQGWLTAIDPRDRAAVADGAERARRGGATTEMEVRVDIVGLNRWVRMRLNGVLSVTGRPAGWIALLYDITDERASVDELAHRATHDSLTGLPNRALLEDRLSQTVARAERHLQPFAVMFIDLDDFKLVNDRHGHRTGDQVLAAVAQILVGATRAEDTVARLGGDEFVVVADHISRQDTEIVAHRLAEALARPLQVDGMFVDLEASVGVAWTTGSGMSPTALLDAADKAMYVAKQAGRRVAFAPVS